MKRNRAWCVLFAAFLHTPAQKHHHFLTSRLFLFQPSISVGTVCFSIFPFRAHLDITVSLRHLDCAVFLTSHLVRIALNTPHIPARFRTLTPPRANSTTCRILQCRIKRARTQRRVHIKLSCHVCARHPRHAQPMTTHQADSLRSTISHHPEIVLGSPHYKQPY